MVRCKYAQYFFLGGVNWVSGGEVISGGGRGGKNKVGKSLGFSHLWRIGDSAGTQTQDPQLRRLLLYSAELPNQILLGLMHKNVL